MKIITRITLFALLALLIGAAGCGKKDADGDDAKNGAGTTKTDGATDKEGGKSNVGGFGK